MDNIYETINSIVDINCVTTESDLGVLNALHDAYTKAYTMRMIFRHSPSSRKDK